MPDTALGALRRTPDELAQEVKEAAVCKWYEQGLISQGKAAELLDVSRSELLEVLYRHDVTPFQQTPDELSEEARRGL
jgi:predicted HTH domain antitoxin